MYTDSNNFAALTKSPFKWLSAKVIALERIILSCAKIPRLRMAIVGFFRDFELRIKLID
jgi:hypothetical protein